MAREPLLSVLVPAYNAAATVREAVESALDNGFADLEVVVVDDGSTDGTVAVVESIRHPSLRLLRQPANLGVGRTRRAATAQLRGRYAAMLDADDLAVAGRFARQVECLAADGGPDIVGGAIEFFGDGAGVVGFPLEDAAIRATLMFYDLPLCNGAACLKLAPLREGRVNYGEAAGAEDYALWADALAAGLRFANLPQVMTRVRRHAGSLTRAARERVFAEGCRVRRRVLSTQFPALGAAELDALTEALSVNIGGGQRWLDGARALARAVAQAPAVAGIDGALFRRRCEERLLAQIDYARGAGVIDYDTLEALTEQDSDFERWRNADGGALDCRIMALVA